MRVYTAERVAAMSPHQREQVIDGIKTSNDLTVEEKEANLALFETHDTREILADIAAGAADIDDLV